MGDSANAAGLDLADPAPSSTEPRAQEPHLPRFTAFQGQRLLATGALAAMVPTLKAAYEHDHESRLLVFEDGTGRLVEVDLRGSVEEALRRLHLPAKAVGADAVAGEEPASGPQEEVDTAGRGARSGPRSAGRPRLGVVSREVTLLPRHWEWLNRQPGGASVALRRLVDEARRSTGGRDRMRQAQEVTYRFMLAMGGDLPGYEEALRALFAGRRERFGELLAPWPADIRDHALRLAAEAFPIVPHA